MSNKKPKTSIVFKTLHDCPDGHTNTSDHHYLQMTPKPLHTEMVPRLAWFSNVRDHVKQSDWDKIKEWCYRRAGYHCEVCGSNGKLQGRRHRVEAHEIWHYDDINKAQHLVGLISLCPNCHKAKHYGRAISLGEDKFVRKHLKEINNWTWKETFDHCKEAIEKWQERSVHNYTLNMDYLKEEFGLDVVIHRKPMELTEEILESIKHLDNYKDFRNK